MSRPSDPPLQGAGPDAGLDPLRLPLRGSALIEASAGTGKTFTIAALYLRLVLGHGGPGEAFERALTPPEVLVVTFTDAATKELRDRIRARLAEAAQAFLADPADVPVPPDPQDLIARLRAELPPSRWPAAARRLRLAAEWMDEAAVSTIHGWCWRMLREHAFDSGSLFRQTLQTDARELLAQVQRDHWRCCIADLDPEDAATLALWFASPEALGKALVPLLPRQAALPDAPPPREALADARVRKAQRLAQLREPFLTHLADLRALFTGWSDAKLVLGTRFKRPDWGKWLAALEAWAQGEVERPALSDTAWSRLCRTGLAEVWKGEGPLPDHPLFTPLDSLHEDLAALPDAREQVLAHAARWVSRRLAQEQERRAELGFDDLLKRLDAALQGPNGDRLAALIRRQFPVALIDEFQDTDPVQYRIFDRVYGVRASLPASTGTHALILIGDPKQAIYAFRGADIHTYLRARADTAGRHHTLGRNFRSSGAMVAAVNHAFGQAQRRDGPGPFRFRRADEDPVPFVPVSAQGRPERLEVDGAPQSALTAWVLDADKPIGAGEAVERLATACASEIVRLLQGGQAGRSGLRRPDGAWQALRPGDIAVLVNKGSESTAVRQALAQRGVRSVYLSEKESVFEYPLAADLQRWLLACAQPDDARRLRAALATASLGLDARALERLRTDELHWESQVMRFRTYRDRWRRQGVLPLVRALMQDFGVAERLLGAGDERGLTDLLHLAELLQQAAATLDGEHALIRHLAQARQDAAAGAGAQDSRQLRLESDAALVKVVTVHKSKGLEYPLVFLPFASAVRPVQPDDRPLLWHDDEGRARVTLSADPQALLRADEERLGEDLRKLYVALTRARHATWIGLALTKDVGRGALAHLIGQALEPGGLVEAARSWADGHPDIAVTPLPAARADRFEDARPRTRLAPEPPLPTGGRPRWWIASYSALRLEEGGELPADAPPGEGPRHADAVAADAEDPAHPAPATVAAALSASAAEALWAEERGQRTTPPAPGRTATGDLFGREGLLHDLPRGAGPGSFLHGLLEWAGREGFARAGADAARLKAEVRRRCEAQGWGGRADALAAWLLNWLHAPWDLSRIVPGTPPVAPVGLAAIQVEMEFWFPTDGVDLRRLDALVTRHTLGGRPRPPLAAGRLDGLLKGFIDLVFEHDGRWYVADHKSNALGADDTAYDPASLEQAILDHRYDLQYVLYLFALHRLLRTRRGDAYDYSRDVGGAVYLFLRGHAAPGGGLHLERPPVALMDALDRLVDGHTDPGGAP